MRHTRTRRKLFAATKLLVCTVMVFIALYRPPTIFIHYHAQPNYSSAPSILPPVSVSKPVNISVKQGKSTIPKITKFGNRFFIDFTGATGIWLYFTPDLQYVVDSPNDEKKFYRHWDTLRKLHIPISQLSPRPDFKTKFKRIKLGGFTDITIKDENGEITTSPGSLYTNYHLSNIINNKKINLLTENFTLGECKVQNSEIDAGLRSLNLSNTILKNTDITYTGNLSVNGGQLDNCALRSIYPKLSGIQIKSLNQLEFRDSALLENINGNGKLALTSIAFYQRTHR